MSESADGTDGFMPLNWCPQPTLGLLPGMASWIRTLWVYAAFYQGLVFLELGDLILIRVGAHQPRALAAEEASLTRDGHRFGFVASETRLSTNTLFVMSP